MVTEDGPKVLEYNVRFGDPETEALMLLLSEDTDLAEVALVCPWHFLPSLCTSSLNICKACAERRLDYINIKAKPGFAVSVVLASQGYPASYPKGKEITIDSVPSSESYRPHSNSISSHNPCRCRRLSRRNDPIQR